MDLDILGETITPVNTTFLVINATGALALPSGTTGQQPAGAAAGWIRWNTTTPGLEFFNGTVWGAISSGGGGVSTFSAGTTGFTPSSATAGAITLAGILIAANGGTGTSSNPTSGQVLVGTSSNTYAPATIGSGTGISTSTGSGTLTINNTGVTSNVAGTAISISGATGAVTINNTGVTALAGTANQITASASTGSITVSLPSAVTLPGTLIVTGQLTHATGTTTVTPATFVSGTLNTTPVAGGVEFNGNNLYFSAVASRRATFLTAYYYRSNTATTLTNGTSAQCWLGNAGTPLTTGVTVQASTIYEFEGDIVLKDLL